MSSKSKASVAVLLACAEVFMTPSLSGHPEAPSGASPWAIGAELMHQGRFDDVDGFCLTEMKRAPKEPSIAVLAALNVVWQEIELGPDTSRSKKIIHYAELVIGLSDSKNPKASFWKASAQALRLFAESDSVAISSEEQGVLARFALAMRGASIIESFQRLAHDRQFGPDATLMIGLFDLARNRYEQGSTTIWDNSPNAKFFTVESGYLLAASTLIQGRLSAIQDYGLPLALQLHGQFPKNALFTTLLYKIELQLGDITEARSLLNEIHETRPRSGLAREAAFYEAVLDSHSKPFESKKKLTGLIEANPRWPRYLVGAALLRRAAIEQHLGQTKEMSLDLQSAKKQTLSRPSRALFDSLCAMSNHTCN